MRYLIVAEHDDSLHNEHHGNDESAEAALAVASADHPGGYLLFREGKLMAHASDGEVYSYRPDEERAAAAA